MSADVKSVPPWKLALIEKRRKQEQDDRIRRKEEEERLTQMPTWKRDILLKKQQQKNSVVFFAKPALHSQSDLEVSPLHHDAITNDSLDVSVNIDQVPNQNHENDVQVPPVEVFQECDSSGQLVGPSVSEEVVEHIIPIQQNPWLRTDIQQRRYTRNTSHRLSSGSDQLDNSTHSYNSLPRNVGSTSWREQPGDTNDTNEAELDEDEIFNDNQEVAYGRGFVHKLLKKFKHLSAREDKVAVPKRAHSTENILEESHGSGKNSPRNYSSTTPDVSDGSRPTGIYASPVKARSMENLAGSNKHSAYPNLDVKIANERLDIATQGSLDGSFSSSGGMQSPRSYSDVPNHIGDHIGEEEPVNSYDPQEEAPSLKRYGSSENLIKAELPRANIVSSTRSLFENVTGTLTINKTKRKAPSPKTESVDFNAHTGSSLPNGTAKEEEHLEGMGISRVGGESRDGVSGRPGLVAQVNGKAANNDRNANYKSDSSGAFTESRTSIGPAATRSTVEPAAVNGGWSASTSLESSNTTISHSIMQKNNQNNNRLSSQHTSPTSTTNSQSEIISPDKGSIKAEYNLANISKKRHAPLPPSSTIGDTSRPHVSVVQVNDTEDDDGGKASTLPKKHNLYLDLESRAPKQPEDPRSYRDMYFGKGTPSPSSSGTKDPMVSSPTHDSQKDLISTDLSGSHRNGVLEESASTVPVSPSKPSSITSPTTSSSRSPEASKVKPVTSSSSPSKPSPSTPTPKTNSVMTSSSSARPAPTSSKPANGHAASLTLPIPKAGEVSLNNKGVGAKKGKRPASSSGSGPGSLLIRPASNLVPTSANKNAQLPSIKKYNDVKSGVFQPPSANPSYLAGLEDEFDIPVTNIDDVMDDVPVTNIDDLGDSMTSSSSPRLEQDADKERKILSSRYDFIGAGVTTSKNLLIKTRRQKLRITFNDSMTSTYEYPSEQSLLEELPPEPGDFDYIQQLHGRLQQVENPHKNEFDEPEDLNLNAGASLRSTPGIGSGGGLASYRSRYMDEYQLGVDIYTEAKNSSSEVKKPEPQENEENVQVKPAEDDDTFNWSNAASSDLLF